MDPKDAAIISQNHREEFTAYSYAGSQSTAAPPPFGYCHGCSQRLPGSIPDSHRKGLLQWEEKWIPKSNDMEDSSVNAVWCFHQVPVLQLWNNPRQLLPSNLKAFPSPESPRDTFLTTRFTQGT